MKRFILSLALLVPVLFASAQVPGYMGKKHLFIYTPSMSMFSNQFRVDDTKASSLFFFAHNVQYTYVIKKRKAISLFYETAGLNTYAGSEGRDGDNKYIFADYRKHQMGFAYRKYFRSANLAPLGTYMKYSVSVLLANSQMMEASIPYAREIAQENGDRPVFEHSSWHLVTGVGIGKQFVIAKYIPLNFELDVQLPWSSFYSTPESGLEKSHIYNTMGTTLVKFNVGIGLLAF